VAGSSPVGDSIGGCDVNIRTTINVGFYVIALIWFLALIYFVVIPAL